MSDDTETNNDEQPPRPAAPRFGTSLVSLIAIVLSTAALLVSVFEVSAIREEQRIQAWPYVTVNNGYGPDGFRIVATNKGIGPARIRTHDWYFDDQPITDLDQLIASVVPNDDKDRSFSYETYSISELAQTVMSPDEAVTLFSIPWSPVEGEPGYVEWIASDAPNTTAFANAFRQQGMIRLCYCSVYDDCWLAELGGGEPESVKACPAD